MANATATPVIDVGGPKKYRIFQDLDMSHVWGTITVSASPATYVTGGLPIAWTVLAFPSSFAPYFVRFVSAGGPTGGQTAYRYLWNKPAGAIQIFTAAGVELASASAIPAAVSSDVIQFEAIVQRA